MCRSIKTLRLPPTEPPVTEDEMHAAALQFVRKVSGMRQPSPKNADAFDAAVAEVTAATERLLALLPPARSRPKVEAPTEAAG